MSLFSITDTELFKAIVDDAIQDKGAFIKEYIDRHNTAKMVEGEDYYFKRNKITKRVIYKYENDVKVIDHEATNNKLASGWHKLLVDQKVGYLVGDPVTIGSKSGVNIEAITDVLGEEFDDALPELVKAASNKGREWLHPYVDDEGNFDYIVMDAKEIIPIYDNSRRKNIVAIIRVYTLDDDHQKIEFYDDKQVTFYEIIDGKVMMDASEEINPASHFYYRGIGYGWEKVPFIEFANNEERVSDLTFYKDYIDVYDNSNSDVANTLEDIQEIFYVIKGYEGTDIAKAVTNLKRYKGVAVSGDDGSGVDTVKAEVPVASIHANLDRIKDDIFINGQGVDISADKLGNSPSGVSLKFLFSFLDMKSNVMERKFSSALTNFYWFVCEYLSFSNQGQFDYKDLTSTFNKSMIMNEVETVDIIQKGLGIVSKGTLLANHPFVSDIQAELDALEKENEGMVILEDDEDVIE